jgi:acetyl-CoA C-acetyltransferase
MKEVVVAGCCRTPQGMHGGAIKDIPAQKLAEIVFREVLARTKIDPAIITEVILGCCAQPSEAANVGRVAALMAGVPNEVTGYTVARNCASGLEAVISAYRAIQSEEGEVYLVGGAESMSSTPYCVKGARWGLKLRHAQFTDMLWEGLTDPICNQIMGRTAENVAEKYGITRDEQDAFAVESHKKAFMATRMGKFKDEIVPVKVEKRAAGQVVASEPITQDEGINPTLSVQKLALYPTVFKQNGTVTPGNACPISDGAAALLVCTEGKAKELGLDVLGHIRGYAYAGVDPAYMGLGPGYAIPKALKKAGLKIEDIQLIELNEAFAAQVLADAKILQEEWKIADEEWKKVFWSKVNVNGGAIALGHPVGATGARQMATLLYEMRRRDLKYGFSSMCVGGGQGGCMVFERK